MLRPSHLVSTHASPFWAPQPQRLRSKRPAAATGDRNSLSKGLEAAFRLPKDLVELGAPAGGQGAPGPEGAAAGAPDPVVQLAASYTPPFLEIEAEAARDAMLERWQFAYQQASGLERPALPSCAGTRMRAARLNPFAALPRRWQWMPGP